MACQLDQEFYSVFVAAKASTEAQSGQRLLKAHRVGTSPSATRAHYSGASIRQRFPRFPIEILLLRLRHDDVGRCRLLHEFGASSNIPPYWYMLEYAQAPFTHSLNDCLIGVRALHSAMDPDVTSRR